MGVTIIYYGKTSIAVMVKVEASSLVATRFGFGLSLKTGVTAWTMKKKPKSSSLPS
jgi:hypothetical protein